MALGLLFLSILIASAPTSSAHATAEEPPSSKTCGQFRSGSSENLELHVRCMNGELISEAIIASGKDGLAHCKEYRTGGEMGMFLLCVGYDSTTPIPSTPKDREDYVAFIKSRCGDVLLPGQDNNIELWSRRILAERGTCPDDSLPVTRKSFESRMQHLEWAHEREISEFRDELLTLREESRAYSYAPMLGDEVVDRRDTGGPYSQTWRQGQETYNPFGWTGNPFIDLGPPLQLRNRRGNVRTFIPCGPNWYCE
jgi:hypothetical protein